MPGRGPRLAHGAGPARRLPAGLPADWPHREHSRVVERGGLRWHLQVLGRGPPLLLLHGTGASTHSFRDLMPLLAERFTVLVPDLPGHGFTTTPARFEPTLPALAAALVELLEALEVSPVAVVGHSAGAAVAARLALDGSISPRALVGLGAAMVPFRGLAGVLFLPAARLLARSPLASRVLASQARDQESVARMLRSTGSALDARGVELYRRLSARPEHVAAVLSMMASWDLAPLFAELPELTTPFLLVAGQGDRAVPVAQQREAAARLPAGRLVVVRGAGHLVHEEQPERVARLILGALARSPRTRVGARR